jgi:hypothetical protein
MPIEPDDVIEMLGREPWHTLDPYQQWLLVARCYGATNEELAAVFPASTATLNRDFDRISAIVSGRLGLEKNLAVLTHWVDIHLETCLPYAAELIKRRAMFAEPPTEKTQRRRRGA